MSKSSRSRTARKLLMRGVKYHQERRTASAEECLRNAVKVDPRCAEALRLQGLIALEAGRYQESLGLISAALALNPEDIATLTSLADAYLGQGEVEQAIRHYKRVIQLCPQSAQAHTKLGEVQELVSDFGNAADSYRRALALEADSPAANCKLAYVLRRKGDLDEALRLYEYALKLDSARSETYAELGLLLTDRKNLEGAKEAFERSLALKPDCARTALTLAYFHLKNGDITASADSLRRAIKLDPNQHLAHLSMGSILQMMGDYAGALECYERARVLYPSSADVVFYRGLLHLLQGNFAAGWEEYEQREEARRVRKNFSQPQWKGEPLGGARIFLHPEQGLGDTLQAVRYVPFVAGRGGQVVLAVQSGLYRLLAGTEGAWQVISEGGTVSDFRWHCPLLSLPFAFGTDLNTIPANVPYVFADPALVMAWRERLGVLDSTGVTPPAPEGRTSHPRSPASVRIGLTWRGDPKHPQDFRRSIPLEQLAPLTYLEGTTFYSLQVGPSAQQVRQLGARVHLIDLQDELKDFADTAAVVANLDLVISVDTSVVHLAGAMGKRVWILLNNSPDWRWLLGREDSPWYPTARLFRQSTMGNWHEVLTRVEGELRDLVARQSGSMRQPMEKSSALRPVQRGFPPCLGKSEGSALDCGSGSRTAPTEQSAPPAGHTLRKPLSLTPDVRELLREGITHHQAGRLGAAECYYRRILESDPMCPQALHLLGLLAQQAGQYQESVRLIGASLALNPDDADTLNNLANSYIGQGQMQPASHCLQRLAELRPQSTETHHRLGNLQERLGEWEAALASYQRALTLQPDSPDLWSNLARLQTKQGAFPEAVESCRRALAFDPNRPELHTQLGNALSDVGDHAAAWEAHQRALALKPDSAEAVCGLGYLFERKGDLASAARAYQTALKLDPRLGIAHLHLGTNYSLQGDLSRATESFERLQELEPDSAEARSFLALIHLRQGNFRAGWSEYEDRWKTPYGFRFRRKLLKPLWKGEPLGGSRILLYGEQGLGDTLQFVRYVPLVSARGGKVILEVNSSLRRLLESTSGASALLCFGQTLPEFDWQCPLASLPLAFGTELNTIPAGIPYVHADPAQVEAWRARLAIVGNTGTLPPAIAGPASRPRPPASLRIGLVWAGGALHPHDLWRSIPLEQLAPLTSLEGTTFYSLQMGPPAEQMRQSGARMHLIDLQHELKDFADTAAAVANLDLVISVDTSVAHLAGAMGKTVWILLQKSADWRWLIEREDSPWYPTARLFRQSTLGNWQDVITRVERELREHVASSTLVTALPR